MDKETKLVLLWFGMFLLVGLYSVFVMVDYETQIESLRVQLGECKATACEACYGM